MLLKLILRSIGLPMLFLVLSQSLNAQRTVTGTVTTGASGVGIDGVSVVVKGTSSGVTTNSNGKYSISVPGSSSVLVFSSAEYQSQEITVGNQSEINVVLVNLGGNLAEVVVVGYGTQQRRAVTNAITTVNPEQFNKGNISNVAQLLQGKVAGLSIARPGSDPNGSFAIRLRGLSSLGNVQPLVVVDNLVGADLNSVDPYDIKSIDILKDGSAAAIYGTRGSAGVIIITTKSGSRGNAQVNYNGSVSLEDPFRFTPHMTAAEFRALGKGTDYKATTDWNKEITRTAISHTHNISLSGGNSSGGSYNASVNYRKAEGVAITTGFEQVNTRLNLTQKALKDKLTFNFSVSATKRNNDIGFPEAFKYATIFNPTSPVHTTDPLFNPSGSGYFELGAIDYANPVAALEQNKHQSEIKRLNIIGSAEYEITKGLKFLVRYGQQTSSNFEVAYLPRTSFLNRDFLGNISGYARGGYAYKGDFESFNKLYENTLSYDTHIKTWKASFLAGYSYQDFLNQGFSAQGGNFVTDLTADNLNTALDFVNGLGTINSYKNGNKLIAFFGRMNLNFDDVVYLSASLRREGSTQFGKNNQWGMFPAVSAAVDLTKLITIPSADNLKLRASYGVTGSLPPSSYLSLQTLSAGGSSFYAGNNVYLQAYGPNKNANPDLKWERKAEVDIGLDFGLFNKRLSGSVDYYNRTTSDLIFQVTVPSPPALSSTSYLNIGELKSSGVELSLNYDVLKNKTGFGWTTGGTFSTYKVKLAKLDPAIAGSYVGATNLGTPGQEATQITRAVEGQAIGILWGKIFTGIDKTTGLSTFKDLNGDGLIDQKDETNIGNGLPDFEFGWSNTLTYKKFDFNFFLRGSIGQDIVNTFRAFFENPNVATTYNVVNSKYFDATLKDPSPKFSSLFVEKGSFVKLDNATIGYTASLPKSGPFRSLRAYITAQNLFMITGYTGVDPEVRYADTGSSTTAPLTINVLAPGVDRRETWVLSRSFTLGINLGF
ncbi:MAG: SusC/RagA family TonB-linked outer membrane protein [Chitinophagaceae bacterium]